MSLEPPVVKMVSGDGSGTNVLATAPPLLPAGRQFNEFQSGRASAPLSSTLPSISNAAVGFANGALAAGLTALIVRPIGTELTSFFSIVGVLFGKIRSRAAVVLQVNEKNTATTTTPRIHFGAFHFVILDSPCRWSGPATVA